VAVFSLMVGLSFCLFHGVWAAPDRLAFGGQDATLFDWFLAWTPHALGRGVDPLFTHAIGAPAGVNLMGNTAVVLLGTLMAPVTSWAGPLVSYNLLATLAPHCNERKLLCFGWHVGAHARYETKPICRACVPTCA
jgi:hypothetical protein